MDVIKHVIYAYILLHNVIVKNVNTHVNFDYSYDYLGNDMSMSILRSSPQLYNIPKKRLILCQKQNI